MSSLIHLGQPSRAHLRSTLRSTGALGLAMLLTGAVLVAVATLVDTWAGA